MGSHSKNKGRRVRFFDEQPHSVKKPEKKGTSSKTQTNQPPTEKHRNPYGFLIFRTAFLTSRYADRSISTGAPVNEPHSALGTVLSYSWLLSSPLLRFISSLFYIAKLARAPSKRNRKYKIASSLLSTSIVLLAATTLTTLGLLGFSIAPVLAPLLMVAALAWPLIRGIKSLIRAYKGQKPDILLAQKKEKLQLAEKTGDTTKALVFTHHTHALTYFLEAGRNIDVADYAQRKKEGKTHEKYMDDFLNFIFQKNYNKKNILLFQPFFEWVKENHNGIYIYAVSEKKGLVVLNLFFDWMKQQRDNSLPQEKQFQLLELAINDKALAIFEDERTKLKMRILFFSLLAISLISAVITSLAIVVPFFLPALAATFSIVNTTACCVLFSASTAACVVTNVLNYRRYRALCEENKERPDVLNKLKISFGLQAAGGSILLAAGIVVGVLLLAVPFVNLAVLAGISAAAFVVSFACVMGGIYSSYKANQAAKAAQIAEEKMEEPETPQPSVVPAIEPGQQAVARPETQASPVADTDEESDVKSDRRPSP